MLAIMTQRDLASNSQRKYALSYAIPSDLSQPVTASPFPLDMRGTTLVGPSPSGRRLLLARASSPGGGGGGKPGDDRAGGGGGGCTLEVWSHGRLLKEERGGQVPGRGGAPRRGARVGGPREDDG